MELRIAQPTRVLARALALAGVTLLGIASAPAHAAAAPLPVPPTAETTAAARQVAAAHWGGEPCAGAVEIRWERLDPSLNAMARWVQEGPGHGGPFRADACSVEFNLDVAWDWPMFCTVMTHELGHLSGQDHRDGDLIMSPYYMGPSDECVVAPPPGPVEQGTVEVTAPPSGPPAKGRVTAKAPRGNAKPKGEANPKGEAKPKGKAKAKRKIKKRRARPR